MLFVEKEPLARLDHFKTFYSIHLDKNRHLKQPVNAFIGEVTIASDDKRLYH